MTPRILSARAFAPGSCGNTGSGFDVLGFCLERVGDHVTAVATDTPGVRIRSITGVVTELPLDAAANTGGMAALSLLKRVGADNMGVDLLIEKGIPVGSGLGGSSSSAVAAAVAVNALLPRPAPLEIVYQAALDGEAVASGARHGDNVAPCLYGGMVIAATQRVVPVKVPDDIYSVVAHPSIVLETKTMRGVLPQSFPLKIVTEQTLNLARLLAGCWGNDIDLIAQGLKDVMIEPHRAPFIPGFDRVLKAALSAGALGGSIAGAGPSVFVWVQGRDRAQDVATVMQREFGDLNAATFVSSLNAKGARVVS